MINVDNKKVSPFAISLAVVIVVFLLRDPALYLVFPDRALYLESGWKSYNSNRSRRISFLLWFGADPNKIDNERGYGPLHTAAHWGNTNVLRQLLTSGANPNLNVLKTELTAMNLACKYASQESIDVLLKFGATTKCVKVLNET